MSLKKRVFSGLLWNFTDNFMVKGMFFIVSLVLARLLGPKEFGLIGMISVFIAIGISLVDSGMSSSIVRTKNTQQSDYCTVFYMNIAMSLLVYFILFFSAPYIAQFYEQNILTKIIRVYCFSFVISALSAVQLAILNKQMKFKKIMRINIPGAIVGAIVGISLGYFNYGVWSIVWMYLSTQIVQSIMLWSLSDWKPSLIFSNEKMKYHYAFGYKLMLSGLLDTVFNNIYNILIGKYFTVQSLGYYERSKSFNEQPVMMMTNIINNVSYPLLAEIQNKKEKIAQVYRQILKLSFFIIAPIMLGVIAIAKPLFILVLGDPWIPAVPIFQILCLASMFYPIHAFNINALKVYGRSDLFLRLEIIKKAVIVLAVLIAFQFGIYGLVWSNVFVSVIALFINTHYSSKMINYSSKDQLFDMLSILTKAFAMYLFIFTIAYFLRNYTEYIQIIIPTLLGIVFYFLLNYILKSEMLFYMINLIKEKIK